MSYPPPDQPGSQPSWDDPTIAQQPGAPGTDATQVMAPSGYPPQQQDPHTQQYPPQQQDPYTQQGAYPQQQDPYAQPQDPYGQPDPYGQQDPHQGAGGSDGYYDPPNRTGVFVGVAALLLVLAVVGVFYLARQIGSGDDPAGPVAEVVPVPTVLGEAEATATNRLVDAGFTVRTQYEQSADSDPGIVLAQDPVGGSELAQGSEVLLTISAAADTIEMPTVVGLFGTEAVPLLESFGFVVVIQRQESEDVEVDRVISQSIEPGQQANPGATVTLVVSAGSDQETVVPNIVGLASDQATLQLGLAGFSQWSLVEEPSDSVAPGLVIRVSPAPGATVAADALITVVVSSGPATTTTATTAPTSSTDTTATTAPTSSTDTTATTAPTSSTDTTATTAPTSSTDTAPSTEAGAGDGG